MSDYPRTLLESQRLFPDEAACARHLERIRWPDGFECPCCRKAGDPWRLQARPRVLECPQCGQQVSLTSGTIMHRTRQPLPIWFWAAYLVTTQTPGMSALQFQKQLGIKRYETAFLMLHKLRAAMVRPGRDRIGANWPVEVDETYVGGATQGEGRGRHHKTLVVGMVEVLPRKRALGPDPNLTSGQRPQHRVGHGRRFIAGRLRLQVIPNRKQETIEPAVLANIQKNTEVRTDGWTGYDNLHEQTCVNRIGMLCHMSRPRYSTQTVSDPLHRHPFPSQNGGPRSGIGYCRRNRLVMVGHRSTIPAGYPPHPWITPPRRKQPMDSSDDPLFFLHNPKAII